MLVLTLALWPVGHASLLWSAWQFRREPVAVSIPVAGLATDQLRSSWHAPRSGGRTHQGADLFASRGTPVVSATAGLVWRVGHDPLGGQVVWVLGEGHRLYYYAHLDAFAPGLERGDRVCRGDAIGRVGNTGNARTTPPHLHFGVYRVGWTGVRADDPVPWLRRLASGAPSPCHPGPTPSACAASSAGPRDQT